MPKRRRLVRLALISAGLLCAAVVVAASAVVLHGPAPMLVAVAAAVAAGAAATATNKGRAAAADAAWKAAAITVTAVVLVAGLAVLAGGAVASIGGLGAAAVGVVLLLLRGRPVRKVWSVRHGPLTLRLDRLPAPVSQLRTPALSSEWRWTTAALTDQLAARTRQALVQWRHEALDELERRDPIGFARWLAVGALVAGDPAQFMQDDGGTDAFGGQQ